ncbi:hypothetical protein A3B58_00215 [Candidatus Amesbacteria bacterium RIFCSPLOWO2_01_FULL_48_50]|nr:MAG: hypothetical protein A2V48_02085 [Candidatus Amesbacteria bacterium RBG_19FT_COMBO_48_16]OGD04774.1 MAG: hypothetical protein A3B58_00215 [Candidatus Amesbacteria bacterium RIFCSPLOWO2_01_FULL_48_50]
MSPIEGFWDPTDEELAKFRDRRGGLRAKRPLQGLTGLNQVVAEKVHDEGLLTVSFSPGKGRQTAYVQAIGVLTAVRSFLRRTKGVEVESRWIRDEDGNGRMVIRKK